MRRAGTIGAIVLGVGIAACTGPSKPLDLLRAGDQLVEASAPGLDRAGVLAQVGRQAHLWDVSELTLPAGPPSRLRFSVDVPRGARLTFTTAISAEYQSRPGVEFVVKVVRKGREDVVFSRLIDPISRPEHRGFVAGDVDLGSRSGPVELVFETRGFEANDDPQRAVWGAPAITVPDDASTPLAIIYLVDTLRADHTGPYGYGRNTTPELGAFAKDAVVFETAVAHASWTKPSVASILTSLLPGQHRAVQLRDPLESSHVLVSEMLHAKGFSTGAAIANSVIYLPESNFDRGFDSFVGLHGEEGRPSKLVDAAGVVDTALRFLESRRGMPRFLYVHTMDPHVPYAPPPPFDRMFEPRPTPDHPATDPRTDFKEPLDRERMIAQYDGDVAYGDREFGRFVRELKSRGLYDRALIVFLGDHGEEFQDHGQWLHGRSLFDELIRIPLVVKFPGGGAGRRVARQVQGVDVLPTVLAAMGLPVPPAPVIAGRPLQEALAGNAPRREAIAEISHRGIVAHGVRTESDKFVRRFNPEQDELYFDLTKDPGEKTNALGDAPERVRRLRARAEEAMAPNPFRHVLRFAGGDEYVVTLRTGGWIEGVETTGFGQGERHEVGENGRRLEVRARPRAGLPREVAFTARPLGAPVWLEGKRAGRLLRKGDVRVGQGGTADAIPFRLPEVDTDAEAEHARVGLFTPPSSEAAGVQVWLVLPPGRKLMEFDADMRERLKALGYLGQ